jgi:hypothetical protein
LPQHTEPNGRYDRGRLNASGEWPASPTTLPRGIPSTRDLAVFNDTFAGQSIDLKWSLRVGTATGPAVAGATVAVTVPLGGHVIQRITFTPPAGTQPLVLVLSAIKPGRGNVFHDDGT